MRVTVASCSAIATQLLVASAHTVAFEADMGEERRLGDFQDYSHGEAAMIAFCIGGVACILWMLMTLATIGWMYSESGRAMQGPAAACSAFTFLVGFIAFMMALGWAMEGSEEETMYAFCIGAVAIIITMLTGLTLIASRYTELSPVVLTLAVVFFILSSAVALVGFVGGIGWAVQDYPETEYAVWCVGGVGILLGCLISLCGIGTYYQQQVEKGDDSKPMASAAPVSVSAESSAPATPAATPAPAPVKEAVKESRSNKAEPVAPAEEDDTKLTL
mmetsp:Transcript_16656/g.38978  ORF Transcript_16656/g.38978 Transcript_16656/m.38978 type:complete len:275 (-) Transcript_16656:247-1071(-)